MSFLALLRAVVSSDHLHFHMQSMFVFIVHCNGYFPVSANYKTTRYQKLINSAFNGFSHIYLPLSFIEVIKCTGEFLLHQRKFGMPFIVDGKRGRVQRIILESFQPEFYKTSFLTSFFQLIFDGKFACRSVIDGRSYSISISRMLQKKMSSS